MGLAPLSTLSVEAYHLILAYLMPLPYETPNHLGVLLTRPFQDVLVLQVHERKCLLKDPNLDHSQNENSGHFPERGMN
jgi:hypothetical protein